MKKIIRKICLPLLMLGASVVANAQVTWYYGNNAGVKFTNGIPSAVDSPNLKTGEGSAVLVDKDNNVVMYCNGTNVWNGNNVQQSVTLKGDKSATQTALIVPVPGSLGTRAFIFTVAAAETNFGLMNGTAGLQVTLARIDGVAPATTVTTLDTVNLTPGVAMSEKLTITEDGAGGYWVVTHGVGVYSPAGSIPDNTVGENKFYAFKINCGVTDIASLNSTKKQSEITSVSPIKSSDHGENGPELWSGSLFNGGGQMKFSSDGTKIVNVLPNHNHDGDMVNPEAQLFNFNKVNGTVDNASAIQFSLGFQHQNNTDRDGFAYGVEFSPNGKIVYVSSSKASDAFTNSTRIYQYNVNVWNSTTINASKTQIAVLPYSANAKTFGALMAGPNGKIYIAKNHASALDVIDTPNTLGTGCSYKADAVLTPNGTCVLGLPTTVLIANSLSIPALAATNCKGDISITSSFTGNAPNSYSWYVFGSDANGNPVTATGAITWSSNSFYFKNLGSGASPLAGAPPAVFPTADLNSIAICGRYYTSILSMKTDCGSVLKVATVTFQVKCPSIPALQASNCKGNIAVTSSYTGPAPASYCWYVYGSDAKGNPVTLNGSKTYSSNSFYFDNLGSGTAFLPGTPPTAFPIGNLNIKAICGRYYTSELALKGECGSVVKSVKTTFLMNCNDPSFSSSITTTNASYYTLACTPNDIEAGNNPGFGYAWYLEDLNSSNGNIFSMSNITNWWIGNTVTNNFKDFDHVSNPNYAGTYSSLPVNNAVPKGKFIYGHNYRITRGTWDAVCTWKQFSLISKYTPHRNADGSSSMDVTFVADNTAPDFSYLMNQTTTHVKSITDANSELFLVYPNPSDGLFTIELKNESKATMQVFDITGKVVKSVQLDRNEPYSLDLSGYAKGIYMIKMNGEQQYMQKIILQ